MRLSTDPDRASRGLRRRTRWCKSLTGKGVFGVILGLPNTNPACAPGPVAPGRKVRRSTLPPSARHCSGPQRVFKPRAPHLPRRTRRPRTSNETYLPSLESSPRPHARFPRPHEDAGRAFRDQRKASQGAQAPRGLKRRPWRFVTRHDRAASHLAIGRLRARPGCACLRTKRSLRDSLHGRAADSGTASRYERFARFSDRSSHVIHRSWTRFCTDCG